MLLILVMIHLLTSLAIEPLYAANVKTRIATLSTQEAIMGTQEASSERNRLQGEMRDAQHKLKKLESEIRELEKNFAQKGDLLSSNERLAQQEKARKTFETLQAEQMRFQQYIQAEESRSTRQIQSGIQTIAKEIARREHYDMVLESDAVIYMAGPSTDITGKVTRIYNERFPASGSSQSKTQAAAVTKKPQTNSKPPQRKRLAPPSEIR
jgi:outer membrane protein